MKIQVRYARCVYVYSVHIKVEVQYLALTGADAHMAVLSVEGVGKQPQTLTHRTTQH